VWWYVALLIALCWHTLALPPATIPHQKTLTQCHYLWVCLPVSPYTGPGAGYQRQGTPPTCSTPPATAATSLSSSTGALKASYAQAVATAAATAAAHTIGRYNLSNVSSKTARASPVRVSPPTADASSRSRTATAPGSWNNPLPATNKVKDPSRPLQTANTNPKRPPGPRPVTAGAGNTPPCPPLLLPVEFCTNIRICT